MTNSCYYVNVKSPGAELLLEKFLDYQKQEGEVKKLKDFAAHCQISETYMNLLMNDRRSLTAKMAVHLAKVLNEPRFYDVADLPRHPDDHDLEIINRLWPYLSEEDRQAIADQAERFAEQNAAKEAKRRPLPSES